jgi:hypothetical protein
MYSCWSDQEERGYQYQAGGYSAPPGIIATAIRRVGQVNSVHAFPLYKRIVAARDDLELYKPIKIGNANTTTHEIDDLKDKSSENGPRVLLIA